MWDFKGFSPVRILSSWVHVYSVDVNSVCDPCVISNFPLFCKKSHRSHNCKVSLQYGFSHLKCMSTQLTLTVYVIHVWFQISIFSVRSPTDLTTIRFLSSMNSLSYWVHVYSVEANSVCDPCVISNNPLFCKMSHRSHNYKVFLQYGFSHVKCMYT